MNKFVSFSLAVFVCLCMLIATERTAYAYVDPGSGFLALQSLASVAAACGYFLRRRIKSLFIRTPEDGKSAVPAAAKQAGSVKPA